MKLKLIVLCFATVSVAFAQESEIKTADKNYNRYAYIDAIKIYEGVANKGYKSADLFQKLGNSYYFNSEFKQAEKWYAAFFDLNEPVPVEYYYRYAQTLKAVGSYEKAGAMMDKFSQKSNKDNRAKAYRKYKDYLELIKMNSGRYTVENAGINSKFSDYGTTFLHNQLVFTSARDTMGFVKRKDKWTNQSFTNLYTSTLDSLGNLSEPERFSGTITTKVNESTPAFTKDGQTMYFTRNNFLTRRPGKGKDKKVHLKIYRATLKNKKWTNVEELPFNSDEYSVAHPALSPDEKTLYFSSDMPGTIGQSDIYKVAINGNGGFSPAENLGVPVNTEGKETFPFISETNELYFASDGHPGLGGLDIFISPLEKGNTYKKVYNVGAPLNSNSDDFAFWINPQTKRGFFSTNREEGLGYDDIFKFEEKRAIRYNHRQIVSGVVVDEETGKPLSNMIIQLFDSQFKLLETVYTDQDGKYSFDVKREDSYYVRSVQSDPKEFETKEMQVLDPKNLDKIQHNIAVGKRIKKVTTGDDLAKVFAIENVLFSLNKYNINPNTEQNLAKVIAVMEQYPNMKIDICSHTDSRASEAYNANLSNKRAQATLNYMLKKGIDKKRLTAKGYGELQLLNDCSDGVSCTEEQHQINRRSEFIINMNE